MMWGWGYMGWWGWCVMFFWWVFVVAGIIAVVRWFSCGGKCGCSCHENQNGTKLGKRKK